jgi:electron transfer flavoprotein alpha subunit
MSVLVWAEQVDGKLRKSAAHAVSAGASLGEVTVLVLGSGAQEAAQAAAGLQGVARVLYAAADAQQLTAEALAQLLADAANAVESTHLFAAASPAAKGVLPRVCARLDVMQLSEVVRIESADTFVRPIYAGSALATVRSSDRIKVVTVRVSAFAAAAAKPAGDSPAAAPLELAAAESPTRLVARNAKNTTDVDLADARVVVSGGRGMGSAEQYKVLEPLATRLGAALGASRAAVDAGYAPPERQVGQTGRIVAPEFYLAFGISGAVQHLAGMKDSGKIIAVNKDPEAPIFQVADVGLVADLFEVIPVLERSL